MNQFAQKMQSLKSTAIPSIRTNSALRSNSRPHNLQQASVSKFIAVKALNPTFEVMIPQQISDGSNVIDIQMGNHKKQYAHILTLGPSSLHESDQPCF